MTEDRNSFKKAMHDVRPLKATHKHYFVHKNKTRKKTTDREDHAFPPLTDGDNSSVGAEEKIYYRQSGISNGYFNLLKLGKLPLEASLDLHGLNSDIARNHFQEFMQECMDQNLRVLHIIHGKGAHRPEPALLKNKVNAWLRQYKSVLAFCSALPKDGGSGAVYVLLRNKFDER